MSISATIADTNRLFNGLKDANEALVASAELFSQRLKDLNRMNTKPTCKYSLTNHVANFKAWLSQSHTTVPSCFPSLDRALNGMDGLGLPIGLYVVGGESSAGKTTFLHAIMDGIAKSGHDVIIISLEMSANELLSKSVSRESFLKARREHPKSPWPHAYSYKKILKLPDAIQNGFLKPSDRDAILKTLDEYHEACNGHMIIRPNEIEGLSAKMVRNLVKDHIDETHKTPVLLIDYLQILKAPDSSASDKSNIDQSIQTCAEISKEFQTPVFVISALNRVSYSPQASNKPPVKGLSAFKESGLIEYAADIALMIEDLSPQGSTTDKTIKINVLKNRNGPKGGSLKFTFVPEFNFFLEDKS